jgi:hypothetical protein
VTVSKEPSLSLANTIFPLQLIISNQICACLKPRRSFPLHRREGLFSQTPCPAKQHLPPLDPIASLLDTGVHNNWRSSHQSEVQEIHESVLGFEVKATPFSATKSWQLRPPLSLLAESLCHRQPHLNGTETKSMQTKMLGMTRRSLYPPFPYPPQTGFKGRQSLR